MENNITDWDRKLAQVCIHCPVCSYARRKQKGIAFSLVKFFEGKLCPFCAAYERVYGKKAHEPNPDR